MSYFKFCERCLHSTAQQTSTPYKHRTSESATDRVMEFFTMPRNTFFIVRALVGKFEVDLYLVLVDSCSIFISVFNNLISVYVFILSRGLNRRMLRVKRTDHYLILVSCIIFTLLCLNRLEYDYESTVMCVRIDGVRSYWRAGLQ